jgi:ATP-dependent Lhr-like helicase
MPTLQQQAIAYVRRWFRQSGWKTFAFQEETWQAFLRGEHGLVHSPTGTGKTLAVFLGPVIQWLAHDRELLRKLKQRQQTSSETNSTAATTVENKSGSTLKKLEPRQPRSSIDKLNRVKIKRRKLPPLNPDSKIRVLWITPLRALATDTETNLQRTVEQLGLPWKIEKRTGDTDPAIRSRQRTQFPELLITTPESLTLMLSWPDTLERFSHLDLVVVDEWHELLGTKRGVQTELALARVRKLQPHVQVWGLSATIGNLREAADTLVGPGDAGSACLIRGNIDKRIEIQSIIPEDIERFPWAGHLGIRLAPQVAQLIATTNSALVFTNTRSQTELWYSALLKTDPGLAGQIAVHHGSLDRELRFWVEDALRDGNLRCVVCTASLDLGVDFTEVDHVIQIGSPKGNARLLQRAGRSGHQPGVPSRVTFVPTNAIELVELAALRDAIAANKIESRQPASKPLDVLAQHLVTIALGGGFVADELLAEVRATNAYQSLTDIEWQWVMDFVERGGSSLTAYPDFHRIKNVDGRYVVAEPRIARLHRLSIGTIVSDAAIVVKYLKGRSLGSVEESFISRMEPGDRFLLGGMLLELIKVHDNAAWVRQGKGSTTTIPRWMGGRMPLSSELSQAIREKLQQSRDGFFESAEMRAVQPLLELQNTWSILPGTHQLLIERLQNRDGFHIFVYPFEGRLVHEGMAALFAWRLSRLQPISFSMAMNDYGFVLVSPTEAPLSEGLQCGLLEGKTIAEDIASSLNASEMSKRHFREIARIAGLIFEGYPGQPKKARHLQASSNLFYDVFTQYDPENLLLLQARREVLEQQLEHQRLVQVLQRINAGDIVIRDLERATPLAFPLIVDGLRDRLSSEKLSDRIRRMQASLEKAAEETMSGIG